MRAWLLHPQRVFESSPPLIRVLRRRVLLFASTHSPPLVSPIIYVRFPEGALVLSPQRWRLIKLCGRAIDFDETGIVSAMSKVLKRPSPTLGTLPSPSTTLSSPCTNAIETIVLLSVDVS